MSKIVFDIKKSIADGEYLCFLQVQMFVLVRIICVNKSSVEKFNSERYLLLSNNKVQSLMSVKSIGLRNNLRNETSKRW